MNGNLNAVGTQANPIFIFPTAGAAALTLTQSGSASNANCLARDRPLRHRLVDDEVGHPHGRGKRQT